jgi:hypothetical protein
MSRWDNPTTDLWIEHFQEAGLCSLCGQRGIIDTRGLRSPAGVLCGKLNFCICPNGQALRTAQNGVLPQDLVLR